jgi:integrase
LPVAKRELSQAGPAKTRSRHFSYLNNALNIATKANVLAANPLEGLEPFRVKRKTKVEILTPEEMRAFLSAIDRDRLPFFAICAFTGLRREEVSRLDWTEIKLERSLIDLPAEKGKNNRRKLEQIPANLAKILKPFGKPVPLGQRRNCNTQWKLLLRGRRLNGSKTASVIPSVLML